MHVHLDMRQRNVEQAFANLVRAQKLLFSMVPNTRYANNFCKPNRSASFQPRRDEYGFSRFYAINPCAYLKYRTLEVRLHSATTNHKKINHWISLLIKVAESQTGIVPAKFSELRRAYGVTPTLLAYIKERVDKFKDQHGDRAFHYGDRDL